MAKPHTVEAQIVYTHGNVTANSRFYAVWTALRHFLGLPILMLALFIVLAFGILKLEQANPAWIQAVTDTVGRTFFRSSEVTGDTLGVIASGLITQISIVISMLLLVLQQVASNMGNLIYDQFLDRYRNQFYLGFVLGAIVLVLMVRSAIADDFNPVFSATVVFAFLIIALALLVWFIFSAIHQMRPETIAQEIHDNTDGAYRQHLRMLSQFREKSQSEAPVQVLLRSKRAGFLVDMQVDRIRRSLKDRPADVEVVAMANLGDYLTYGGILAQIKAEDQSVAQEIADAIEGAYVFENEMSIRNNPQYGLKQLETMAWTEGSTAKQNPETVMMTLNALRDLFMRWLLADYAIDENLAPIPFVYVDAAIPYLIDMLEALGIVSTESMQHETFGEVLDIFSETFAHQPEALRERSIDAIDRLLSALGDHALAGSLDRSLSRLEDVLLENGASAAARRVKDAHQKLAASVGRLDSRATRVNAYQKENQNH